MKKYDISELNEMYRDAESCDADMFAEMRSNLLLVSGNHYSKKSTAAYFENLRASNRITENQKLRLTKNHIHKVTRHYINSITSKVPGVAIAPQNDLDMQDRKSAELNQAVWADAKDRYKLKELLRELVHNFVEIGEKCVLITWNPNAGEHIGYEPQLDELGQAKLDEQGGFLADQARPLYSGGFEFKIIPAFNLLRAPQAKSMKKSPYHIVREMMDKKELEDMYKDDPKKLKFLGDGDDEPFIVFDSNTNQYKSEDSQVLVRYHFFRPCNLYPNGYFYLCTERGILEEGELPFGIYPLVWQGFDTYSTNPRAYSIVKIARPYQAEINRASSQAATHQITVGDDKILYQGGTKLAQGALLPGVRGITYNGLAPQILPGRTGEQFLPYIQSQITELYSACMIEEINIEAAPLGQMDAYALLFRSASQKQKFAQYTEKVETFLKEFCMTFLDLARHYYPEDMIIQAVGKSEAINIVEFKNTKPLSYQIKVEEQAEDVTTKLGRQLALNHLIQYAGNNMDPKQLALIAKDMPFLNENSMIKKLSLDYDNAENDMLSIERGIMPFVSPYADNKIFIDIVTHRMKQPDFSMLNPQIRQMYSDYLSIHENQIKKKTEAQQAAKDGFIPISGTLITVSMHVPDPSSQSGTRQVRLPYDAITWLLKRLEAQGASLKELEQMNQGVVADMYSGPPQAEQQQGLPPQGAMAH